MAELELTPQVFAILSALIQERVGLSYSLGEKPIFEVKAGARMQEAGFPSFLDYYYFLRYDDPEQREFRALVEALLVHETFFFREHASLEASITQIVLPRVQANGSARVWCAACATGEEAYTLAMLLRTYGLSERVELLASDLSESALARARSGRFSPRALRQLEDHVFAQRYLQRSESAITIAPELLAPRFLRINLSDQREVTANGQFDLIVCRNALIYFAEPQAKQVVESLTRALLPGGALLVGVSESLLRFGSKLVCEERGGVFFYRKSTA